MMQGSFGGSIGGGRLVSNEYISNDQYVLGWALFIGELKSFTLLSEWFKRISTG